MLVVPVHVAVSPGRGLGLFVDTDLPMMARIWMRNVRFDRVFPNDGSHPMAKSFLDKYSALEGGNQLYLCVDDARFINHAEDDRANVSVISADDASLVWVAKRPLLAGEELFVNYRHLCLDAKRDLGFVPA